jgi:hypothetical protein
MGVQMGVQVGRDLVQKTILILNIPNQIVSK